MLDTVWALRNLECLISSWHFLDKSNFLTVVRIKTGTFLFQVIVADDIITTAIIHFVLQIIVSHRLSTSKSNLFTRDQWSNGSIQKNVASVRAISRPASFLIILEVLFAPHGEHLVAIKQLHGLFFYPREEWFLHLLYRRSSLIHSFGWWRALAFDGKYGSTSISITSFTLVLVILSFVVQFDFLKVFKEDRQKEIQKHILAKDLQDHKKGARGGANRYNRLVHVLVPIIANENHEDSYEALNEVVKVRSGTRSIIYVDITNSIKLNLVRE